MSSSSATKLKLRGTFIDVDEQKIKLSPRAHSEPGEPRRNHFFFEDQQKYIERLDEMYQYDRSTWTGTGSPGGGGAPAPAGAVARDLRGKQPRLPEEPSRPRADGPWLEGEGLAMRGRLSENGHMIRRMEQGYLGARAPAERPRARAAALQRAAQAEEEPRELDGPLYARSPPLVRLQADSIHVESPMDAATGVHGDMLDAVPHAGSGARGSDEDAGGLVPLPAPQPQTLTRAYSMNSGFFRVHWTVDARKLRGNDKQAVSPPFELSFGEQFPKVTFKMMIYPKVVNESKGGASFKKARGRGYVQLKCEAELSEAIANVSFRISIGSGDNVQAPRGPVSHNFSSSAVCGLPREEEEWDFSNVVDQESMTFVVCLEIVPTQPRR